jgi:NADH-quinone oxidoreductase subunit E
MLTQLTRSQIIELQKRYPQKRSALIPALHLAQAELGYLPQEVQAEVAALFDLDQNEVHAVVTFYDMFFEKPCGKRLLHVCKNLSCMLRGADQVTDAICKKLNITPGETDAEGEFTLIPSECLGACDCAPVVLLDRQLMGPVHPEDVERLLSEAKGEKQEGGHA